MKVHLRRMQLYSWVVFFFIYFILEGANANSILPICDDCKEPPEDYPLTWEGLGVSDMNDQELMGEEHLLTTELRATTMTQGSIPLTRGIDGRYTMQVSVGTPPQFVSLVIDTEASSLLLFNQTDCAIRETCFDSSTSSTFKPCNGMVSKGCPRKNYCAMANDVMVVLGNSSLTHRADHYPVCISYYHPGYFRFAPTVSGLLGLGYNPGGGQYFLRLATYATSRFIALDLNHAGDSWLTIGGHALSDKLQWSESQIRQDPYHWFPVHDVSMCGVDLLTEVTMAVISSSTPCLGLPGQLYKAVLAWLNATCDSSSVVCFPPEGVDEDKLPDLLFTISQQGDPLRIPIADLLIARTEGSGKRLCITRTDEDRSIRIFNRGVISLGALVLNSLYVALDFDAVRVGLTNKRAPKTVEECLAPVKCTNGRVYQSQTNSCENPRCSYYWFQRFDTDAEACVTVIPFKATVISLAFALSVAELVLSFTRRRFFSRVLADGSINVLEPTAASEK